MSVHKARLASSLFWSLRVEKISGSVFTPASDLLINVACRSEQQRAGRGIHRSRKTDELPELIFEPKAQLSGGDQRGLGMLHQQAECSVQEFARALPRLRGFLPPPSRHPKITPLKQRKGSGGFSVLDSERRAERPAIRLPAASIGRTRTPVNSSCLQQKY